MRKLIVVASLVLSAASVLAQGTVVFNNRVTGTLVTHVYLSGMYTQIIGNGWDDTPAGTTDWTGFTRVTGSGWSAAIRAANGAAVPEGALSFGLNPTVTTFRTGSAAGNFAGVTAILNSVTPDAPVATLQVFAWWNQGGILNDPEQALAAWRSGQTFAGLSNPFTLAEIGGYVNTPPVLVGLQSFNIIIPEPGSLSLLGLGICALWFSSRRSLRQGTLRT